MRIDQMTQEEKDRFIPEYKRQLMSIAGIMGLDGILEIIAELASELADEGLNGKEFRSSPKITASLLTCAAQASHACDELRQSLGTNLR